MLSAPDAELARRDASIPGLARLLDPEAFAETLRELCPDAGISAILPRYVRYKSGTSCLVGYRVVAGDREVEAYAKAYNPAVDGKAVRADEESSVRSALGSGVRILADDAIVFYPFPNDRRLPALTCLEKSDARREMLRQLLPDLEDLWDAVPEALRYKPERRFVARVASPSGRGAVLKFYTKDDYREINRNVERFESDPPLRIPRRLCESKEHRAVSIEWVEGTSLRESLLGGAAPCEPARLVGAALARLHVQKAKIRVFHTAESYAESVLGSAEAVAELAPPLAGVARATAERIADRVRQRHWRARRSIHGDLSAEQVVLQDDTASIIDMDRASRGDPRIDLGTFRARLIYDVVCGHVTADAARECLDAFLAGYRDASEKDVTRKLDRFTAASLLHLAVEPFRYRSSSWSEEMETIVARAHELAGDGGGGGSGIGENAGA